MSDNPILDLEAQGQTMMKALSWSPDSPPDWDSFRCLFHKDALLVPAARPTVPIPVEIFIDRMNGQRLNGSLAAFAEKHVTMTAHVFGNVATVLQTYQTIINDDAPGYGISAMTWVRDNGAWLCISMAWDAANDEKPVPEEYL